MKILKNIVFIFTYWDALEEAARAIKSKREDEERASRAQNLQLCWDHQQERMHSHYSKQNCDHCKLLKKLADLQSEEG